MTSLSPSNSTSKLKCGSGSLLISICGTPGGIEPATQNIIFKYADIGIDKRVIKFNGVNSNGSNSITYYICHQI
jgi:hypothetical protein